jgi:CubicO group peptidase (beta-lactamase class C family)
MKRTILALVGVLGCAAPPPAAPPAPACGGPCVWTRLADVVDSGVAAGAAPGAVVAVSSQGVRYVHGTGQMGIGDTTRPGPDTVYDLASLTKVIGLTTGLMFAVDEGRIRIDDPAVRHVPAFRGQGEEAVTIRHLLTHSSGLPAHRRLWELSADRPSALAAAAATPLDTVPGARTVYSDIGAILLTEALERAYGARIDSLLALRLFAPLAMSSTRYLPPAEWADRVAPTERDPWRGRVLRGEVHDENAFWLGGVSGHAGLFGSAADLLQFGEWLLNQRAGRACPPPCPVISQATAMEFTRRQEVVPRSSRALGWDTPSPGGSAGTRFSDQGFGHTGFTGTSIWIDPTRDLVVVLLANRVHPTRDNPRLGPLRGVTADRTLAVTEGAAPVPVR